MKLLNYMVVSVLMCSALQAIPIELFKSKNAARWNNQGVTMQAKIISIDCNYKVGYGNNAPNACRAKAYHKLKGQRDQGIFLIFDKYFANKLQALQRQGDYRFVSCVYTHKKKIMSDCTIK